MNELQLWINELKLEKHVEGGFYRRAYTCKKAFKEDDLPFHKGERPYFTTIYYALPQGGISMLHRLKSDETWFFHAGGVLKIYKISANDSLKIEKLGMNLIAGERPQITLEAGTWFAAAADESPALVSCAVVPGFSFEDFELAEPKTIKELIQNHPELIKFSFSASE
ncbi:MAG: cupin domain-containing protein [Candidatus Ozemobacteraceae bacterium]